MLLVYKLIWCETVAYLWLEEVDFRVFGLKEKTSGHWLRDFKISQSHAKALAYYHPDQTNRLNHVWYAEKSCSLRRWRPIVREIPILIKKPWIGDKTATFCQNQWFFTAKWFACCDKRWRDPSCCEGNAGVEMGLRDCESGVFNFTVRFHFRTFVLTGCSRTFIHPDMCPCKRRSPTRHRKQQVILKWPPIQSIAPQLTRVVYHSRP